MSTISFRSVRAAGRTMSITSSLSAIHTTPRRRLRNERVGESSRGAATTAAIQLRSGWSGRNRGVCGARPGSGDPW